MAKILTNLKSGIGKTIINSKFLKRFAIAFWMMGGYSTSALAAPSEDGYQMIENLIILTTNWIRYIGGSVMIFGLVSFIMALKSHNSEGQSNAAMMVVCGAMLCAIKSIVSAIGVI